MIGGSPRRSRLPIFCGPIRPKQWRPSRSARSSTARRTKTRSVSSRLKASKPLVDDPDIFRAAKLMIDQHGEEAALQAAQRADELLGDGDLEGGVFWRRIAAAVEELWRGRREGEPLN